MALKKKAIFLMALEKKKPIFNGHLKRPFFLMDTKAFLWAFKKGLFFMGT